MITLTAKGRLFVEAALKEAKTASLIDEATLLGPDPWSRPLSPARGEDCNRRAQPDGE